MAPRNAKTTESRRTAVVLADASDPAPGTLQLLALERGSFFDRDQLVAIDDAGEITRLPCVRRISAEVPEPVILVPASAGLVQLSDQLLRQREQLARVPADEARHGLDA